MTSKGEIAGKSILGAVLVTLVIASALPVIGIAAGDITITATVGRTHVAVGDTLTYQVIVAGSERSMPTPDVEIPPRFRILTGPNSSLNVQWINGRFSTTRTLTWILQAVEEGEAVIPAPVAEKRGDVFRGPEVRVQISDEPHPGGTAGSPQNPPKPSGTTPNRPSSNRRGGFSDIGRNENVFIDVQVEPQEVYLQQPLIATYTLYFREQVSGYDIRRLSSTEGFWTEPLARPNQPDVFTTTINGREYRGAVIYKLLLFPTRTGDLEIGPMEMMCEVQRQDRRSRGRSLFDDLFNDPFFGGYRTQRLDLATDPVPVEVLPLPGEGRPAGFSEVVGDYSINAHLDADSVETNESVTFTVTIEGEGNIGFLPEPEFNVPPDIEMYDPQTETKQSPRGGTLRGEKTFQYLLIPRRAGAQPIPAVSFSFFDPDRRRYRTISTEPKTLYVSPARGWSAANSDLPGGTADEVRSIGTDIRWIHDATRGLRPQGTPLYQQAVYPLSYLLPLIVVIGAWAGSRRMNALEKDARSRKAAKRAMRALKEARDAHKGGQIAEGYDALARGLYHYIADRIHMPAPELNQRLIQEILQDRKVAEEQRHQIQAILQRCDTARFTPAGKDPEMLLELLGEAQSWVMAVDKRLENGKK